MRRVLLLGLGGGHLGSVDLVAPSTMFLGTRIRSARNRIFEFFRRSSGIEKMCSERLQRGKQS